MDYIGLVLTTVASVPSLALMWELWKDPAPLWARMFLGTLCAMPLILLAMELRFCLPISWRCNAKWDALLCRLGSHRCVPLCRSGCCWACLRCSPDDPGVKRLERTK